MHSFAAFVGDVAVRTEHTVREVAARITPAAMIFLMAVESVYASDNTVFGQASSTVFGGVYTIVKAVAAAIAVVAVAVAAFKIITGGEKGMESAKTIFVYVLVGIIIVFLAPLAVNTIRKWRQRIPISAYPFPGVGTY